MIDARASEPARAEANTKTRENKGAKNMKMLHSFKEFGWVAFWVAFCVFLFAVFIPTVNRALNL